MIKALLKYLQRRLYTFLNSWWGFSFFLALLYFAVVRPITNVLSSPCSLRGGSSLHCSTINFSDNIGSVNLESTLAYGPIDVVYTWVNGSDPVWLKKKELWTKRALEASTPQESPAPDFNSTIFGNHTLALNSTTNSTSSEEEDRDDSNRYRNSNELKYSLRSLVKNAPWIHHIYLVTDNQIPSWLNLETSKMSVVSHTQIFSNLSHLPVFSSPAIETHIHRIPNLSKKFIYFNDDVFLGAPVYPEDFVSLQGVQKLTMSWDVPKCAPGCSDSWIGDGYCDKACNVSSCNFDFPDCVNGSTGNQAAMNGKSEARAVVHCTKGCPDNWLGDKICDARCKHPECAWDIGDCGIDLVLGQYPGGILSLSNSLTTINDKSVEYYARYNSIATSHPHLLHEPRVVEDAVGQDLVDSLVNGSSVPSDVDQQSVAASPVPLPTAAPTEPSYYHNYTKMMHVISQHEHLYSPTAVPTQSPIPDGVTPSGNSTTVTNNGTFPLVAEDQQHARDPMRFMHDDAMVGGSMMGGEEGGAAYGGYHHHGQHYGYDDMYANFFQPPEPVYGPPVVASVPVGTKAVYVDISLLPCLFQINSTCNPTQPDSFVPITVEDIRGTNPFNKYNPHNYFLYSHAEHSDTDNSIVQSVTLLQKHSLLVVLLYATQEEKPTPPPLPINITFTVTGTQASSGDRVSATFAIEITPVVPNDVQYSNLLPSGMHLINESHSAVVAPSNAQTPSSADSLTTDSSLAVVPSPAAASLDLSSARVLKIPYRLPADEVDGGADAVTHEPDTSEIETVEGVVVEVTLPLAQQAINPNDISLALTVTLKSELQYSIVLPLCSALMHLINSPVNQLPQFTPSHASEGCPSDLTQLFAQSRSTYHRLHYIEYANLDPHSKLLVPPRDTPARVEAAADLFPGGGRLYLALPLPRLQRSVKKQWVHWRIDLTRGAPPSADATHSQWKEVNVNHTTALYAVNMTHQADVNVTVESNEPISSRLAAIVGVVRWGSGSDIVVIPEVETNATNEVIPDLGNGTSDGNITESRRRLGEDTYAQSLIMVNRLYNKQFGNEGRKVPAHLPHMIDKDIMNEMQEKFSAEWNATSTHRFRSSKDMQYSFSYYYYLIHRHKANPPDLKAFIAQFVDTNKDGVVDFNELRTVVAMMKGRTPQPGEIQHIVNCIVDTAKNASIAAAAAAAALQAQSLNLTSDISLETNTTSSPIVAESVEPALDASNSTQNSFLSILDELKAYFRSHRYPTVDEVYACNEVRVLLKEKVEWDKRMPTHTLLSDKDTVAFEMIGDNYTDTLSQLDSVRARQSKFICINDNMQKPSTELEQALQDFYLSYFPERSIFELPEGTSNPTLYTDKYYAMRSSWWFTFRRAISGMLLIFRDSGGPSSGSAGSAVQLSRVSLFAGVMALALLVAMRTASRFGWGGASVGTKKKKEKADSDLAQRAKLREHNEGRFLHRHSQGEDYTVDDCEVEKRHAEVFTLGDMSSFELDEDDLNDLDDEELAEQVRKQRSASASGATEYDPTRNEWNENSLTAAETISSLANTGEEYLNALLRNVGWSEEQGDGGVEPSQGQEGEEEDEDSQDEDGRRRESFTLQKAHIDKPLKVSEAHRSLSGDNQYVSMIPTSGGYSSGATSGYYSGSSDSSRNNSLSGERAAASAAPPVAAPAHHGKISFFSGSGKKKPSAPAAATAAHTAPPARTAVSPPPLPALVQQQLSPLPSPSLRPSKSCLKKGDRSSNKSNNVRFSSTIMMGDSAEPVTFTTSSPPRGGRKIMYRGQRVVEFVQGGLNLVKGILANPEAGGNSYYR